MRLLSILALAWLVSRGSCRLGRSWLRGRFAYPFILCGQHSLPVFCVSIFLSFLGRLAMEEQSGWWAAQAAVNIVFPIALVGIGALCWMVSNKGPSRTARLAGPRSC